MISQNEFREKMAMEKKTDYFDTDFDKENHAKLLFNFFRWFQINGEKYMNQSIEKMINIYLSEHD